MRQRGCLDINFKLRIRSPTESPPILDRISMTLLLWRVDGPFAEVVRRDSFGGELAAARVNTVLDGELLDRVCHLRAEVNPALGLHPCCCRPRVASRQFRT
jgi:hypothetical protein